MNKIFKLTPFYSEKVWGYENWNLSTHKNGHCMIEGSSKTLLDMIDKELSILVKIIAANETLSVQVHPDDNYARMYENDSGKTECWYVLEAKENASLICGVKDGLNKESLKKIIEKDDIEKYLNRINVKSGDMIYIPSGTVHAIEGGIRLIEIQQSSDITYRIYDWGRDREMHVEKALDVIDYDMKNYCGKIENFKKLETKDFTVEKIEIDGIYEDMVYEGFHSYTVISGCGFVICDGTKINIKQEESIYISDGTRYSIKGDLKVLKIYDK